jgi:dihydrofolate reductase
MDTIPIYLIVTMTENGTIADKGVIPWSIPGEQRYFKEHTLGAAVLMGRKTWESLEYAPLPGRLNIVLTHSGTFSAPGAIPVTSMEEALTAAHAASLAKRELWIMGGAEVLNHAQWLANKAYVTVLHDHYAGDTKFESKRNGKITDHTVSEAEIEFSRTDLPGSAPTKYTKKLRYTRVVIDYDVLKRR